MKQAKKDERVKILYFLSHPIQYFSPLLKELSNETDLEVCYFSNSSLKGGFDKGFGKSVTWDIPLLEGYKYCFLKNYFSGHSLNNKFWDVWNPGVWKKIRNSSASIILVNDWTYSSSWLVFLAAAVYRKQVWLRAENPLNQELKKSGKVRLIKKLMLKHFLFRLFVDRYLFIGSQSKAFFNYYGVPEKKLVFTPYAVDNNYFMAAWLQLKVRLPQVRKQLAIPLEKKVILFSGKYISKKRPLDLLKAFGRLKNNNAFLIMVGEGMLRQQMMQFIQEYKLENVRLTGFVNQSEMPLYYAIADVFVMCSGMGETWGLAVNEAMNFETAVLVSDTCGCSTDLVQHGINGFVFEEGNINALTRYLEKLLDDDEQRMRMGYASHKMIQNFSIQEIVENIKLATVTA